MDDKQRKRLEKSGKKQLEKLYRKVMRDRSVPEPAKQGLEALWKSHALKGHEYRRQGRLRETLEEYRKDAEMPITERWEAQVPQMGFCLMGDTLMELGETDSAIAAYRQALALWDRYVVGCAPHESLARAFLKQERVDDAIGICEEFITTWPESVGWGITQVLEEAKQRKPSSK